MNESELVRMRGRRTSRTRRSVLLAMSVALVSPFPSLAQPQKVARIGFLAARPRLNKESKPDIYYEAFVQELRRLGYVEGKNVVIEWRFADNQYDRLDALAAELVRLNVDILVTHGTPGVRAAKKATTTIPIVMAAVGDAIAAKLVASLARPGGNVTGLSFFQQELLSKRLELLREAMPRARRVGYLMVAGNPSSMGPTLHAMEKAAKTLKVDLVQFTVDGKEPNFPGVFSEMVEKRVEGVVISEESLMLSNAKVLADLAAQQRLLAVGGREFSEAGGVVGYGMSLADLYRRGAQFVDKLLKGAKPGDIPVEQPTVFELVINMQSAKALGIRIPQSFLVRANKVIE